MSGEGRANPPRRKNTHTRAVGATSFSIHRGNDRDEVGQWGACRIIHATVGLLRSRRSPVAIPREQVTTDASGNTMLGPSENLYLTSPSPGIKVIIGTG